MSSRKANLSKLLIAVALSCASTVSSSDDDESLLNRSFYVPVHVDLCEHFEDVVLYRDDTPLQKLPGTHLFQFTFYPSLKRLEPALERVRIEGLKRGERFKTEIIVTPASVYIGSKKIDLDLDAQLQTMHKNVDARHEPVELTLRCENSCARRIAGTATPSETR